MGEMKENSIPIVNIVTIWQEKKPYWNTQSGVLLQCCPLFKNFLRVSANVGEKWFENKSPSLRKYKRLVNTPYCIIKLTKKLDVFIIVNWRMYSVGTCFVFNKRNIGWPWSERNGKKTIFRWRYIIALLNIADWLFLKLNEWNVFLLQLNDL